MLGREINKFFFISVTGLLLEVVRAGAGVLDMARTRSIPDYISDARLPLRTRVERGSLTLPALAFPVERGAQILPDVTAGDLPATTCPSSKGGLCECAAALGAALALVPPPTSTPPLPLSAGGCLALVEAVSDVVSAIVTDADAAASPVTGDKRAREEDAGGSTSASPLSQPPLSAGAAALALSCGLVQGFAEAQGLVLSLSTVLTLWAALTASLPRGDGDVGGQSAADLQRALEVLAAAHACAPPADEPPPSPPFGGSAPPPRSWVTYWSDVWFPPLRVLPPSALERTWAAAQFLCCPHVGLAPLAEECAQRVAQCVQDAGGVARVRLLAACGGDCDDVCSLAAAAQRAHDRIIAPLLRGAPLAAMHGFGVDSRHFFVQPERAAWRYALSGALAHRQGARTDDIGASVSVLTQTAAAAAVTGSMRRVQWVLELAAAVSTRITATSGGAGAGMGAAAAQAASPSSSAAAAAAAVFAARAGHAELALAALARVAPGAAGADGVGEESSDAGSVWRAAFYSGSVDVLDALWMAGVAPPGTDAANLVPHVRSVLNLCLHQANQASYAFPWRFRVIPSLLSWMVARGIVGVEVEPLQERVRVDAVVTLLEWDAVSGGGADATAAITALLAATPPERTGAVASAALFAALAAGDLGVVAWLRGACGAAWPDATVRALLRTPPDALERVLALSNTPPLTRGDEASFREHSLFHLVDKLGCAAQLHLLCGAGFVPPFELLFFLAGFDYVHASGFRRRIRGAGTWQPPIPRCATTAQATKLACVLGSGTCPRSSPDDEASLCVALAPTASLLPLLAARGFALGGELAPKLFLAAIKGNAPESLAWLQRASGSDGIGYDTEAVAAAIESEAPFSLAWLINNAAQCGGAAAVTALLSPAVVCRAVRSFLQSRGRCEKNSTLRSLEVLWVLLERGAALDASCSAAAAALAKDSAVEGGGVALSILQRLRTATPPCPWDESTLLACADSIAALPLWRWAANEGCPWTSDLPCRAFEDMLTAACGRCRFGTDPHARDMYDYFHEGSNLHITWWQTDACNGAGAGAAGEGVGSDEEAADPDGGIRVMLPENYAIAPAFATRAHQDAVLRAVGSFDAVAEHRAWLASRPGGCPCGGTLHAPLTPAFSVAAACAGAAAPAVTLRLVVRLRAYIPGWKRAAFVPLGSSRTNPLLNDSPDDEVFAGPAVTFAVDAEPGDTVARLCERIAASRTDASADRLIVYLWGPMERDSDTTLAESFITDGSLIGVGVMPRPKEGRDGDDLEA